MPETTTERLGLIKPARDTNTPLDIERLNLNMDVLDRAAGASQIVADTTPPSTELYDGKIVREKVTGKVWMAEKQDNGSFAKKWITWPYAFSAYTTNFPFPVNHWQYFGWGTYESDPTHRQVNSSAADLGGPVGDRWVCPQRGIYNLDARFTYYAGSPNNIQWTISTLVVNANNADPSNPALDPVNEQTNSKDLQYPPPGADNSTSHSCLQMPLAQGDTVVGRLWIATPLPFMTVTGVFKATMINPIS